MAAYGRIGGEGTCAQHKVEVLVAACGRVEVKAQRPTQVQSSGIGGHLVEADSREGAETNTGSRFATGRVQWFGFRLKVPERRHDQVQENQALDTSSGSVPTAQPSLHGSCLQSRSVATPSGC